MKEEITDDTIVNGIRCTRCNNSFAMFALDHLENGNCPHCDDGAFPIVGGWVTKDSFIEMSRAIYGDKFGYDQVQDEVYLTIADIEGATAEGIDVKYTPIYGDPSKPRDEFSDAGK